MLLTCTTPKLFFFFIIISIFPILHIIQKIQSWNLLVGQLATLQNTGIIDMHKIKRCLFKNLALPDYSDTFVLSKLVSFLSCLKFDFDIVTDQCFYVFNVYCLKLLFAKVCSCGNRDTPEENHIEREMRGWIPLIPLPQSKNILLVATSY